MDLESVAELGPRQRGTAACSADCHLELRFGLLPAEPIGFRNAARCNRLIAEFSSAVGGMAATVFGTRSMWLLDVEENYWMNGIHGSARTHPASGVIVQG